MYRPDRFGVDRDDSADLIVVEIMLLISQVDWLKQKRFAVKIHQFANVSVEFVEVSPKVF
jgi:hypothetical protein